MAPRRRSPWCESASRPLSPTRLFFLCIFLGLAVSTAPAQADTMRSSATMFSDSGDWIGGGQPRLFDSDNASIAVQGSAGYLTVSVSGGTRGDAYSMDFAAPPGQTLTTGVYDGAQRASFRAATRPGIDISGDGRGCNQDTGRFEVRDLAVGSNGVPTRLWIVYEQHCEGGQPALFGEVRVGEPATGAAALEPTVVRWPPADLGQSATAVPVTVVAAAPTTISGAAIRGDNPRDFPIRVDDCTGQRLSAGGACEVWVRFVPSSAGSRTAVLRITHADGSHQATALQGFAYGGRTRVILNSDPGDYIGGGASYSYEPANARITASGSRQHVAFGVDAADSSWWYSDFAPGRGDVLAPGRYDATRYPFNGSGPGLDVSGNGRGCNRLTGSYTVTEAAFQPDGGLRRFGASFEQRCEGARPALTGTFEFRAGDTSTPALWMTTGPLTSLPSDDDTGGGGGGTGGGGTDTGGGGTGTGGSGLGVTIPPLGVGSVATPQGPGVSATQPPPTTGGGRQDVAMLVRCRSTRRCRGALILRLLPKGRGALVLGRAKFSISAHGRQRVRVSLGVSARRMRARWPHARLAGVIQSAPHAGGATVG